MFVLRLYEGGRGLRNGKVAESACQVASRWRQRVCLFACLPASRPAGLPIECREPVGVATGWPSRPA